MRWDVRVTAHLYLSAAFLSVCVMAAPDYLHFTDALKAVFFWAGLLGAVYFAISGFRAAIREERVAPKSGHRRRMISLVGMAICAIGFVGFAAAYFWPVKTETAAEASPLDGMIQVSVDPAIYPTVIPQNKMYEMQLNNRFMKDGGAVTTWMYPAGTALPPRDPHVYPSNGLRFRITNYGKIPIINVNLTFAVEYNPNGENSTKASVPILPVFSIGAGESVDVYAMNYSIDAVVLVLIPANAVGFVAGSTKPETFKLIPPFLDGSSIGPFLAKSPPAPPPPSPSPPNKQGKK